MEKSSLDKNLVAVDARDETDSFRLGISDTFCVSVWCKWREREISVFRVR